MLMTSAAAASATTVPSPRAFMLFPLTVGGCQSTPAWGPGREGRMRAQPGVDEPGRPAHVGPHGPVDLCGRSGAVQVLREAPELDPPQAEQRGGRDQRLWIIRA